MNLARSMSEPAGFLGRSVRCCAALRIPKDMPKSTTIKVKENNMRYVCHYQSKMSNTCMANSSATSNIFIVKLYLKYSSIKLAGKKNTYQPNQLDHVPRISRKL